MRLRTAVRWTALVGAGGLALANGGTVLGPHEWTGVRDGGAGADYAWGVSIDGGGNVVWAGYVAAPPGNDGFVERRLPDGSPDWSYVLDNPATDAVDSKSTDSYAGVCTDAQGNVITGGSWSGNWGGADGYWNSALVQKFSSAGSLLWTWRAGSGYGAWSRVGAVATDADGNVWAAGSAFVSWGANQHDWMVWKFDASGSLQTGFPVSYNHSPSYNYPDHAYGLAVHADGAFVVVGSRGESDNANALLRDSDWHVRSYRADRTLAWEDTYPGAAHLIEYARSVAIDGDGDVYVAGYENVGTDNGASGLDWDGRLVKYDGATGARIWTHVFRSAAARHEVPYSVVIDETGRALVARTETDVGSSVATSYVSAHSRVDGSRLAEEAFSAGDNTGACVLAQRGARIAVAGYVAGAGGVLDALVSVHQSPAGNAAPVFDEGPSASTHLAAVGETVAFHAAATDGDGDPVTISWDFGDGATAEGTDVTHAYASAGTRTVVVTATDGKDPVIESVDVVVGAPFVAPALTANLNFAKGGRDTMTLRCRLALPDAFDPEGRVATFVLGGVKANVTLKHRGRAKSEDGSVLLTYVRKKRLWNLTATIAKGDHAADWVDEGLVDATVKKVPVTVKATFEIEDAARCAHVVAEKYTAKAGKWGHLR